jgi:hypothetical protein
VCGDAVLPPGYTRRAARICELRRRALDAKPPKGGRLARRAFLVGSKLESRVRRDGRKGRITTACSDALVAVARRLDVGATRLFFDLLLN